MAGYLKLGEIDGESVEPQHDKWINLLSMSQGMSRPLKVGASGGTRNKGSVICGDVHCVKEMDCSTAPIMKAVCDGIVFPIVKIEFTTSVGAAKRVPYYMVEMKNVMVASYDVSGAANSADVPTESFTLNYEEIKWTYDKMGKDGKTKGKLDATWKVEEGQA